MIQFYRLFGVNRFPEPGKDRLSFNPTSKNVVFVHDNNFFSIRVILTNLFLQKKKNLKIVFEQVLDDFGKRLTEKSIEEVISKCVERSFSAGRGEPIALLTSQHRDKVKSS